MTDPISDMLTRIRNALAVKKTEAILPYSKIKFDIAKILEKERKIQKVEVVRPGLERESAVNFKQLKIILKYDEERRPIINVLKRVSKPGQRIYVKKDRIPRVLNGLGMAILSTSQGLMTGGEARRKHLGGELICEIY